MPTQIYHDAPGSAPWHARRASCYNAGDASAMLGCHPSGKTRTQLLDELHTGIQPEFSDYVQERVIDPGHRIEALWFPIAEEIIVEDLQVLGGSLDVGLSRPLGASLDAVTFMADVLGECKSANEALRAALPHTGRDSHAHNDARNLPKGYRVQVEQQQLVFGATRTLFSACQFDEQGNPTEERHCWYTSDPALRAEIVAGWKQFAQDLDTFLPPAIKEMPKAEVTLALPALFIHAKGEITTSNMREYGLALAERLVAVRAIQLLTDQDFSNAKESAKLLRENIQQAKLAKDAMLAQTVTVGEAARMIDTWCEDMRLTALKLEQDVEREDKAKKAAMIAKAKGDYEQHIQALTAETGGPWIVLAVPDWAGAIKGKRNFASMQDGLDTALANAKVIADESARKIRASLACMTEEGKGYEFLLADRLALIGTPVEHLRTLVRARITEHKAAEAKKEADTRERIRQEEVARIERERQESDARAAREREAEAARQQEYTLATAPPSHQTVVPAPLTAWCCANGQRMGLQICPECEETSAAFSAAMGPPSANVVPLGTRAPAPAGATLRLGQLNERLQFLAVTASDLSALGFEPVGKDRAAVLYRVSDLEAICAALVAHLRTVAAKQQQAA